MSIVQIELTDAEREALETLAREKGKSAQDILKEALGEVLHDASSFDWKGAIARGEGLWAHRDDLPDFDELRRESDRDLWGRD
jgi:hypothetical protein